MAGTYSGTVVIIPAMNEEAATVAPTVGKIVEVLPGAKVYVTDDSPPEHFRVFAEELRTAVPDPDVVLIERRAAPYPVGGLGGAVYYALEVARAEALTWAVVMDSDGQHPPEALPGVLGALIGDEPCDLVVATRHRYGGTVGDGLSRARRVISRFSAAVAKAAFPRSVGGCSDPMSGFFAVRLAAVGPFWTEGFKVLVHLMAQHPGLARREVGYTFGRRTGGTSKAAVRQGVGYLDGIVRLRLRCWRGVDPGPPPPVTPIATLAEESHAA